MNVADIKSMLTNETHSERLSNEAQGGRKIRTLGAVPVSEAGSVLTRWGVVAVATVAASN